MLQKHEIIKKIKNLNLPKDQYWITSGAGLVIHGVKDNTKDIDLGCTTKLFKELIGKGYKFTFAKDNTRRMSINNSIEIFENWNVDKIELIDGLPVGSLESIKKQKIKLSREKDFDDIKMIDAYLKNNK